MTTPRLLSGGRPDADSEIVEWLSMQTVVIEWDDGVQHGRIEFYGSGSSGNLRDAINEARGLARPISENA